MRPALRTLVVLLTLALAACGMASPPSTVSSSTTAAKAVPSGMISLAGLGWKNGPTDRIVLPLGAAIDRRVDQANVITAIGRPGSAQSVLATLTETLPSYGWRITASGGGSLVFEDARYDGAFTSDSSLWALTIRVRS